MYRRWHSNLQATHSEAAFEKNVCNNSKKNVKRHGFFVFEKNTQKRIPEHCSSEAGPVRDVSKNTEILYGNETRAGNYRRLG